MTPDQIAEEFAKIMAVGPGGKLAVGWGIGTLDKLERQFGKSSPVVRKYSELLDLARTRSRADLPGISPQVHAWGPAPAKGALSPGQLEWIRRLPADPADVTDEQLSHLLRMGAAGGFRPILRYRFPPSSRRCSNRCKGSGSAATRSRPPDASWSRPM